MNATSFWMFVAALIAALIPTLHANAYQPKLSGSIVVEGKSFDSFGQRLTSEIEKALANRVGEFNRNKGQGVILSYRAASQVRYVGSSAAKLIRNGAEVGAISVRMDAQFNVTVFTGGPNGQTRAGEIATLHQLRIDFTTSLHQGTVRLEHVLSVDSSAQADNPLLSAHADRLKDQINAAIKQQGDQRLGASGGEGILPKEVSSVAITAVLVEELDGHWPATPCGDRMTAWIGEPGNGSSRYSAKDK